MCSEVWVFGAFDIMGVHSTYIPFLANIIMDFFANLTSSNDFYTLEYTSESYSDQELSETKLCRSGGKIHILISKTKGIEYYLIYVIFSWFDVHFP